MDISFGPCVCLIRDLLIHSEYYARGHWFYTFLNMPLSAEYFFGLKIGIALSVGFATVWLYKALSNLLDLFNTTMTQTPDIFSLADAAWKHPKYASFCILPLEFGVDIDIHKHENSELLCSNRNKSSTEMSGNCRLQKHGKYVNIFHLTKYTG